MIKINKPNMKIFYCDSCGRQQGLIGIRINKTTYDIPKRLTLCEDCANALGRMFINFVKSDGKSQIYNDEIWEIQEVEDEI